ncbi:transcription elongation protein SprT [Aureimonas psammosilenae]|uniref:transcription elongation protein SprT n=1 Tax=Aureimonas psammosilenae TaxID=2495496 RepID=UPI0012609CD1|nr:transcription elongation protein SprT [Aureimonas psammosilenae]
MKDEGRKAGNRHDTRESWLRSATVGLRDHFESCGYPLPEKMRFSIGFTSSGRKTKRVGELWHADASADETFELFIRADLDDPAAVLGILVHQLVHAVVPMDAGHGKQFREAALKLGMDGKMREAAPGPLLQALLNQLADNLGPLPHAKLAIDKGRDGKGPVDRPKKQGTRLLKAECNDQECGYTVRITSKWVDELGAPLCPRHGTMRIVIKETEGL